MNIILVHVSRTTWAFGKTLQVISFIQSIYQADKKYLVICPVSIILNWEEEFKKFSELKVHVYHGPGRDKSAIGSNIILTSYGVLKKEYDTDLLNQEFEVVVLDEVQSLKKYSLPRSSCG